jgi:hypothetical protein
MLGPNHRRIELNRKGERGFQANIKTESTQATLQSTYAHSRAETGGQPLAPATAPVASSTCPRPRPGNTQSERECGVSVAIRCSCATAAFSATRMRSASASIVATRARKRPTKRCPFAAACSIASSSRSATSSNCCACASCRCAGWIQSRRSDNHVNRGSASAERSTRATPMTCGPPSHAVVAPQASVSCRVRLLEFLCTGSLHTRGEPTGRTTPPPNRRGCPTREPALMKIDTSRRFPH